MTETEKLNTAAAARALNCHPDTLISWVKEGLIKAYVFKGRTPHGDRYRFDPADVATFRRERWEAVEVSAERGK